MVDQVTKALYEQTMDAQEGVTDWLLDQMAAQHVKELLLAYYTLLLAGVRTSTCSFCFAHDLEVFCHKVMQVV